ncbi:MAG: Cytochrome b561 [Pseudomonas citronellolis]|nr:MAG: Cytochrome b561 [Pseudomonas citronellolis]
MNTSPVPRRYGSLSIALHWLMLILIAATYFCMEFRGNFPKGSETRALFSQWHFMLGLTVFVLVWLRLICRLIYPTPPIVPQPPTWQMLLAKLAHVLLYGLMIFLPLAGWIIVSAAGKPVPFWGLEFPPLVAENPDLAKQVKWWHETIAVAGYWLIGLHAAGALFHHYIQRDNTLRRMLPGRGEAEPE